MKNILKLENLIQMTNIMLRNTTHKRIMRDDKSRDIDIVIIWVDGGDARWLEQKNKYKRLESASDFVDGEIERYRNLDNLQYVFRGIEKFMPWVRKVHFVTEGHLPDWLNPDSPKLNIVKHSDYIPEKYLPTFSSHPIELNLHRIKGLSEQFIFFNDDMFVIKPMNKTDFFVKGLPCDQALLGLTVSADSSDIFPHILLNVMSTINKNYYNYGVLKKYPLKFFNVRYGLMSNIKNALFLPYKYFPGFSWFHSVSPLLKSTFEEVWQKEPELLDQTSSHKFRSILDVNQFLLKAWQFSTGKFHPVNVERKYGAYFDISDQLDELVLALRKRQHSIICANDTGNIDDFEKTKAVFNSSLEEILPDKSSYEL